MIPCVEVGQSFPRLSWDGSCKFDNKFLERVCEWASMLKWPTQPSGSISLLELYIDFAIYTGTQTPVPVGSHSDRSVEAYKLRDVSPEAKVRSAKHCVGSLS